MEFQNGHNCVAEIKDMLCAKYIKTLCYIDNIETSCAKCMNIMHKIHKYYAEAGVSNHWTGIKMEWWSGKWIGKGECTQLQQISATGAVQSKCNYLVHL